MQPISDLDDILLQTVHMEQCLLFFQAWDYVFWTNDNDNHKTFSKNYHSLCCHLPADLRTARTQDNPVVLLEVETVMGTNLSFLMVIEVELEEQTPVSLNCPLASVWAWMTFGWLERATLAPTTGTPVTVWISPRSTWLSHTQRLQSALGRPSMHTRWHFAVMREPRDRCRNSKRHQN